MTVGVVVLRVLAGEGRPHDPAVASAQRLLRALRQQRSFLLPRLPTDKTMDQMQLQPGQLGGCVQHLDRGIGDFGPDPITRQHADLEPALLRHLRAPSRYPENEIISHCEGRLRRGYRLREQPTWPFAIFLPMKTSLSPGAQPCRRPAARRCSSVPAGWSGPITGLSDVGTATRASCTVCSNRC